VTDLALDRQIMSLFGLIGTLGILIVLIVMGLLSRRLGLATRARPYYLVFFAAAGLTGISLIAHLINLISGAIGAGGLPEDPGWVLVINGLPALAVTLGLYSAWRYWSWLLAERD
jgi:predicted membrane channel-forming protein YqfA (hemolysin III family)